MRKYDFIRNQYWIGICGHIPYAIIIFKKEQIFGKGLPVNRYHRSTNSDPAIL